MNGLLPVLLLSLLVLIQGCSLFIPKETLYLRSAQDRATQEEVRQRLGQPMLTSATQAGEMVWVYEVRQEDPGSRWTSTGLWCDEYVLTFDNQSVLRRWTHKSQFHGGERMPTYCVRGGYQAKS
ncbi:MAG: hypothetical protein AAB049_01105 [Nitrospirota bacterium]|jgi:outer membrane protein assembly factor BamE (lipoprotein component of BamABCDE complex)